MNPKLKLVETEKTFLEKRLELVEILKNLAIEHVRNRRERKIMVSRSEIRRLCAWLKSSRLKKTSYPLHAYTEGGGNTLYVSKRRHRRFLIDNSWRYRLVDHK